MSPERLIHALSTATTPTIMEHWRCTHYDERRHVLPFVSVGASLTFPATLLAVTYSVNAPKGSAATKCGYHLEKEKYAARST